MDSQIERMYRETKRRSNWGRVGELHKWEDFSLAGISLGIREFQQTAGSASERRFGRPAPSWQTPIHPCRALKNKENKNEVIEALATSLAHASPSIDSMDVP